MPTKSLTLMKKYNMYKRYYYTGGMKKVGKMGRVNSYYFSILLDLKNNMDYF